MLIPPTPPRSLVTLQVACIACREQFVVAEGEPNAEPGNGRGQWQPAAAGHPRLNLRFLPQRDRKAITPLPRPEVFEMAPQTETRSAETAIVCPRCGADNRNWVRILHTPLWQQWRVLWPALLGLLITGAIWLIAYDRLGNRFDETARVPFFVSLFLAGVLPSLFLPMAWRQQREYRNARSLLPNPGWISPVLFMALTFFFTFVFILPGALFVAMPLGFEYIERLLAPPVQPTLEARMQTLHNGVQAVLSGNDVGKKTAVEEAISRLEALQAEAERKAVIYTLFGVETSIQNSATEDQKPESTDVNGRAQATLRWAKRHIQVNSAPQLTALITQQIVALEALVSTPPEPLLDLEFLKTWFKYTVTVSLFASLCGAGAAMLCVSGADPHLPPPLYFSLAEMTRVVGWEVKRVLELPGDMSQMEWQTAVRNELGGLTLVGIIRGAAGIGASYVPARRYEVVSDPWGRIVRTDMCYTQVLNQGAPAPPASQAEADEIHQTLADLFRTRPTYLSL